MCDVGGWHFAFGKSFTCCGIDIVLGQILANDLAIGLINEGACPMTMVVELA